jgi:hypothetical protein
MFEAVAEERGEIAGGKAANREEAISRMGVRESEREAPDMHNIKKTAPFVGLFRKRACDGSGCTM